MRASINFDAKQILIGQSCKFPLPPTLHLLPPLLLLVPWFPPSLATSLCLSLLFASAERREKADMKLSENLTWFIMSYYKIRVIFNGETESSRFSSKTNVHGPYTLIGLAIKKDDQEQACLRSLMCCIGGHWHTHCIHNLHSLASLLGEGKLPLLLFSRPL